MLRSKFVTPWSKVVAKGTRGVKNVKLVLCSQNFHPELVVKIDGKKSKLYLRQLS